MKGKIMTVQTALKLYAQNPHLPNTFSEPFGRNLVALSKYDNQAEKSNFKFVFPKSQGNIQATVHGGALASLVDISTTIAMVRMTTLRTISISLNTQFLRVIKVEQQVQVETSISKIGKNVVYSDCFIYTDPHGSRKLSCKGSHIKSIMKEDWDYVKAWKETQKNG